VHLTGHASGLTALDVSADGRALVACGCDGRARQVIVIWDITGVQSGGQVSGLLGRWSQQPLSC
jgi:hypothetical protein